MVLQAETPVWKAAPQPTVDGKPGTLQTPCGARRVREAAASALLGCGGGCGPMLAHGYVATARAWRRRQCRREPMLRLLGGAKALETLYLIGEKIGEGHFGKVYACRETGFLGRFVDSKASCVKVVPLRGGRAETFNVEEQIDFVKQLMQLDHPCIVRFHRFFQTNDYWYAVMDRCLGPELLDYVDLNGGQLDIETVRSLVRQALSAISAVHSLATMHRDVKPQNFRFRETSAKTLQLLDFGFAKPSPTPVPQAHTVSGTLCYAAPEVLDGFYWYACDVWSVGIIAFLLVAGVLPFDTSDVTMLRSMHHDPVITGDRLFRGKRWNQVPNVGRGLIRGLLTVDPAKRLTADEGMAHTWLDDEAVRNSSLTRASSSSRSLSGFEKVNIQRSLVAWNLAEYAGDSDDETMQ